MLQEQIHCIHVGVVYKKVWQNSVFLSQHNHKQNDRDHLTGNSLKEHLKGL